MNDQEAGVGLPRPSRDGFPCVLLSLPSSKIKRGDWPGKEHVPQDRRLSGRATFPPQCDVHDPGLPKELDVLGPLNVKVERDVRQDLELRNRPS
jgi:hypothetical protein